MYRSIASARFLVLVLALAGLPVLADDNCRVSAERNATMDANGVKKIVIGAGAGELQVRGEAKRTSVVANGRACASSDELLGQIRLETRRQGDTLYVKTLYPDVSGVGIVWSRYARLDLTVAVPNSIALDIEDSSGDLELSDVAAADLADSSGDIEIRGVGGALDVTDSSGDIDIESVGGNLQLKDSSGDIEVEEVRSNVAVTVDSSGDMDIRRVAGGVHILADSSGDIEISDVQRDVTIDSDSSGGIVVENVGGNFTVGADASGGIRHSKVLGKVSLPPGS